jgi:hypothetical protein
MSFNGSGTFVINSAGQPVVANTVISATTFNALTADLANGLSTCITKDGQTTPTANIPMGGFKITNLATGTAATDAATVAQIQSNGAALVTVTGTDTLVGTLTPALTTYVTGAVYYFIAPATNTGAVTLNIDTLGAKAVTRDGTTALVAGDITSGEMVAVVYDGTRFQLISAVNSVTNLNVSGTLTVAGATTLNGNLQVGNAGADTVNFQASGWTLTNNVSVTGTWADIGTITTADINGGTIDGTTIGGGTAAAGTFTTVGATTGNITTVNATTVDSTNLEVTNLKAKDGTAAGSIADSTGVVTLNSVVATTADINGGTIDATTIGGSSPAVGNFTTVSAASAVFTTATITTVNTTTLDLTNLEVTNIKAKDGTASMVIDDATGKVNVTTVSAASMNAGVAAVTTLTATGASVASANLGVAVVTNLTATGASVASMNAGVALLTNATVTTLTASGASIASANIGNLQFTAASIASINAGVAVITSLTATGASIASMNAGVALLTTATVTSLTATGASIASANAGNLQVTGASVASANVGVALITTGTVTTLTSTQASIASANVGTAVVTGLTVTNASIASANAGTATLSGNLTLNGGTANGVLYLNGSKVATSGSALTFDGTNLTVPTEIYRPSATSFVRVSGGDGAGSGANLLMFGQSHATAPGRAVLSARGTGYLELASNGGSAYLDSSGNLGIGTSSPAQRLEVSGDIQQQNANYLRGKLAAGTATRLFGLNSANSLYVGGIDASQSEILFVRGGATQMVLDSSGNLGIGTSSPAFKLDVLSGTANSTSGTPIARIVGANQAITTETGTLSLQSNSNMAADAGGSIIFGGRGNTSSDFSTSYGHIAGRKENGTSGNYAGYLQFGTSDSASDVTERMRLDSSGNLGLGVSPSAWSGYKVLQIGQNGAVSSAEAGTVTMVNSNCFFDGANYKYISSAEASLYQQASGAHNWRIAPSGTAGNTISFTQAMTLDASGNWMVGTTTALGTAAGRITATVNGGSSSMVAMGVGGTWTGLLYADAGGVVLGNRTAIPLTFETNSTERARITSGGDFLIGKTTKAYGRFEVAAADDWVSYFENSKSSGTIRGLRVSFQNATPNNTADFFLYCEDATAVRAYFRSNGGLSNYQSNDTDLSDARTKKEITPVASMWDKIGALEIVTYKYNDQTHDDVNVGVIAQQVETVDPVWVDNDGFGETPEGEEPLKTVYTKDITFAAIKALQEAMARIEKLEAEVAALKGA